MKNPDVHVRDVDVDVVELDDDVVGTTMTPVEEVAVDVVEVDGCTYVTDVPTTTPMYCQLPCLTCRAKF